MIETIHNDCSNEDFCIKDNEKCCFLIKQKCMIKDTKYMEE